MTFIKCQKVVCGRWGSFINASQAPSGVSFQRTIFKHIFFCLWAGNALTSGADSAAGLCWGCVLRTAISKSGGRLETGNPPLPPRHCWFSGPSRFNIAAHRELTMLNYYSYRSGLIIHGLLCCYVTRTPGRGINVWLRNRPSLSAGGDFTSFVHSDTLNDLKRRCTANEPERNWRQHGCYSNEHAACIASSSNNAI